MGICIAGTSEKFTSNIARADGSKAHLKAKLVKVRFTGYKTQRDNMIFKNLMQDISNVFVAVTHCPISRLGFQFADAWFARG